MEAVDVISAVIMCADLLSDAVFDDLVSVPFVFTRPVFEVRQAKQDGGDNIYMACCIIFTANLFSFSSEDVRPLCFCPVRMTGCFKDLYF